MPRLVSVFSIPDLGWLEEPIAYRFGVAIRVRHLLGVFAGVFALVAGAPLEAAAAVAGAGLVLGALPVKPPLGKMLARREPPRETVYWAPMGSILVYVVVEEPGELVVLVDGREHDRLRASPGVARLEVAGLEPGEHTIRVVAGRVLRELRVLSGEPRAQPKEAGARTGAGQRREA
ncbi:hypothetical protein [Pyrodictium abyssi]|uniref:Uncharacterized protein n=1 Tax=Pyrodictium abyssi TaxID=54256 RepID=A0ABM8IYE9_9CREN|nr:hypothetical protein PABY_21320 [Pyrodictium abyssi]